MSELPHGHPAWSLRFTGIAKCLLVLMIAGLALNTGFRLWSLVTPPVSGVVLSGATTTGSWQFVDEFPRDVADEMHFILTDPGAQTEATPDRNQDVSPPASTPARSIDALGGPTDALADFGPVSLAGRLARYDDAGKIIAFGVDTRLTFPELTAVIKSNCRVVQNDEVERTLRFTSKNGTHWQCLHIEVGTGDSFLLCETIENVPGPHENDGAVR